MVVGGRLVVEAVEHASIFFIDLVCLSFPYVAAHGLHILAGMLLNVFLDGQRMSEFKYSLNLLHQIPIISFDLCFFDHIFTSFSEKLELLWRSIVDACLIGSHFVMVDDVRSLDVLFEAQPAGHRYIPIHRRFCAKYIGSS